MTRIMFDAVNPANIPEGSQLVAGYGDGPESQWPAEAWGSFPGRALVRITTNGEDQAALVVDCEYGDFSPQSAVDEILRRRARGLDPTEYCGAGSLWACRHAFDVRGIPQPYWWVADPDHTLNLEGNIIALQQGYPEGYDVSTVADYWPGVDVVAVPTPPPAPPATGPDYPEDNLTPHEMTLPVPLDGDGNGYYSASQVGVDDVNNIVSVVFIVGPPATEGKYDKLPTGWAIDAAEQLVIEGGSPGGQYGVRIWTV